MISTLIPLSEMWEQAITVMVSLNRFYSVVLIYEEALQA